MQSFDSMDHGALRDVLRKRVRDGVLLRLIGKWLNAGVLESGSVVHPGTGTPPEGQVPQRGSGRTWQGGVISPLLANIFLHEVQVRYEHSSEPDDRAWTCGSSAP